MDSAMAVHLTEINKDFYTRFGDSFSATRHRLQPGVQRVLESMNGDEEILDLGCGNGWFARELAERGHHGSYLGVDFSLPLLKEAESASKPFPAKFMAVDLTKLSDFSDQLFASGRWSLITAFAVLHHIPSVELRLGILNTVRQLLEPDGLFVHSNWQFLNSEKLKAKIQPWEVASISASDVDAGDYLLDWRSDGKGLRYVHHFSEADLSGLAKTTGFLVAGVFYSDGESGNLSLYQTWKKL